MTTSTSAMYEFANIALGNQIIRDSCKEFQILFHFSYFDFFYKHTLFQ